MILMGSLTASRIYVTEKKQTKANSYQLKSFSVFTGFCLAFNFNVTKNQLFYSLKLRSISSLLVVLHAFT